MPDETLCPPKNFLSRDIIKKEKDGSEASYRANKMSWNTSMDSKFENETNETVLHNSILYLFNKFVDIKQH